MLVLVDHHLLIFWLVISTVKLKQVGQSSNAFQLTHLYRQNNILLTGSSVQQDVSVLSTLLCLQVSWKKAPEILPLSIVNMIGLIWFDLIWIWFDSNRNQDYYQRISDPIDLSTIERHIMTGYYKTVERFDEHFIRVFRNAEVRRVFCRFTYFFLKLQRIFIWTDWFLYSLIHL